MMNGWKSFMSTKYIKLTLSIEHPEILTFEWFFFLYDETKQLYFHIILVVSNP